MLHTESTFSKETCYELMRPQNQNSSFNNVYTYTIRSSIFKNRFGLNFIFVGNSKFYFSPKYYQNIKGRFYETIKTNLLEVFCPKRDNLKIKKTFTVHQY